MNESNEQTNNSNEQNNDTNATKQTNSANSITTLVLVGALALAIGGSLYWWMGSNPTPENPLSGGVGTSSETEVGTNVPTPVADIPDVVAEVNGQAITKEAFIGTIQQTSQLVAQQGQDITDPELQARIQDESLAQVIDNELLAQAAAAANIIADEATVEAELSRVQAQFEDEATFLAELEAVGLDLDTFRTNIQNQLAIEKYLQSEALQNIPEVTEAEARAMYEQITTQEGQELPAFEEIQPQISAQITSQNEQAAVTELLNELRATAEISLLF
jgi:peptidyl-prolyl cis-trans isomerase SurA